VHVVHQGGQDHEGRSVGTDTVQGVVKAFDPVTGDGVVVRDTDLSEYDLSRDALVGSVFRMLRPGQRVVFELTDAGEATHLRIGSEGDMGTPGYPESERG